MDNKELFNRLAKPFDPREVKWKPQAVNGNRALAIAYVDARVVQDRLDDVVGQANWEDSYDVLADGTVACKLRVRIDGEWLSKMDVGSPSEQPDAGDRMKSAFSDALKRAAVKFGVGRYLYRLPSQWCEYDPQKRQFKTTPQLPPSAIPHSAKLTQKDVETKLGAKPAGAPASEKVSQPPPQAGKKTAARIAPQQMESINSLLTELQKPYSWLAENMVKRYGTTEVRELTQTQATELIAALQKIGK